MELHGAGNRYPLGEGLIKLIAAYIVAPTACRDQRKVVRRTMPADSHLHGTLSGCLGIHCIEVLVFVDRDRHRPTGNE